MFQRKDNFTVQTILGRSYGLSLQIMSNKEHANFIIYFIKEFNLYLN